MAERAGLLLLAVPLLLLAGSCARKDAGFRHEGHVAVTKGSCAPCHGRAAAAPRAPVVDDCMECHREAIESTGPRGSRYAALRTGAVAPRPAGYSDIRFDHAPHAAAGLLCIVCHPASNHRAAYFPKMADCRGCHEKEGVRNDCPACHRRRVSPIPKN